MPDRLVFIERFVRICRGERPDRRRGRRKGGERVAAVDSRQARFVGRWLRRAPQQEAIGRPPELENVPNRAHTQMRPYGF